MAKLLTYVGTKNTTTNEALIAAPGAGFRICPVLLIGQNLTSTAQFPVFYDGPDSDGRPLLPVVAQNQESGIMANCVFECDDGQIRQVKLTANKALTVTQTNNANVQYTVWYYIESVSP